MGSSLNWLYNSKPHTVFSQAISPQVISLLTTTTQALLGQVDLISQMNTSSMQHPLQTFTPSIRVNSIISSPGFLFLDTYRPPGGAEDYLVNSQTHLFKTGNCKVNKTYIFIRHFLGSQSEVSYMLSVKK